jgi:thermitase
MKRLFGFSCFLALSVLLAACGNQSQPVQSRILTVRLQPVDSVQTLEQRYGGVVLSWQPKQGLAILKTERLPAASDTAVLHLENNQTLQTTEGRLGLGQPDHLQTTGAATKGSIIGMSGWSSWSSGWGSWSSGWGSWSSGSGSLPSLPSGNSTAFQNIRLPQAHAIAKSYGEGITVAVLDTGLDLSHPGLLGKLASANQYWDYVGNDNNPSEELGFGYGHGTAIAGLILQVAPAAKILPIRVLDGNGRGDMDDMIAGMERAISAGAKVINVSLGSFETSAALEVMINLARDRQVYVVAAAGNGSRQDQSDFPAQLAENGDAWNYLFSIGSVSNSDALSSFTNRGNDVSFYAPGEGLTSFFPNRATINVTGTSFSAPLISGALALGMSQVDGILQAHVGSFLRASQEQQSIWWTINNFGTTPWKHSYGRLDLERFLLSLPLFVPNTPRLGRTDFVINGAFEYASLSGWTSSKALLNSFAEYFSGDHSVTLSRGGWLSQRMMGLTPNTTYVASAWVRVNGSGQSANLVVRNFGRTNVSKTISSNSTFQKVTLEFTTGATSTAAELLFEKPGGSATFTAAADLFSVVRK